MEFGGRKKTSVPFGTDAGVVLFCFLSASGPCLVKYMVVEPTEGIPVGWNLGRVNFEIAIVWISTQPCVVCIQLQEQTSFPEL